MELTNEQLTKFGITQEMIELGVSFNNVDLICEDFGSYEIHKMKYAISMYDIHGLGGKAYKEIASKLEKPSDFFTIPDNQELISNLRKNIGPAKTKTLLAGIENFKTTGIDLWRLVIGLMVDNCGRTISQQFANYYANTKCGIDISYSFDGLQKSVVTELLERIDDLTVIYDEVSDLGFKINHPEPKKQSSEETIYYVMTGSPKEFGYKTKSEFSAKLPLNWEEQKGLSANTKYLIGDDLTSKSSKMSKATKLGIEVILYSNELFN